MKRVRMTAPLLSALSMAATCLATSLTMALLVLVPFGAEACAVGDFPLEGAKLSAPTSQQVAAQLTTETAGKTTTTKRASVSKATVSKVAKRTFTGKAFTPKPQVKLGSVKLKRDRDYTLSYKSCRNAGVGKVIITGKGAYTGKKVVRFAIKRASISEVKVQKIPVRTFNGKAFTPKPQVKLGSVKLKRGRDYTMSYKSNRDIGQGRVIIKGAGNLKGTKTVTFDIVDWVHWLKVAKRTNQLIIVGATGTQAEVSMHVKGADGFWRQVLYTDEGWVGSDGIGKASEYSAHTPIGVLFPDMAFGICPDPGCKMGYTQADWSDYWCGDSYSPYYNQWVSTNDTTDFDIYSSENILSCGAAYDYCLNMGWNKECTPHGGSAFFLHCSTDCPTEGCVAVPEWAMVQILQTIEPGCAIVIDTPWDLPRH